MHQYTLFHRIISKQLFKVISHSATCFGSHQPSPGSFFFTTVSKYTYIWACN